jgi:hypothetical protein
MTVAAMLALVLAVAVPALAQIKNDTSNEGSSGDASVKFSVQSMGDHSNQCAPFEQFGNTASNQNAQGFLQYDSTADDLKGTGGTFEVAPELTAPCTQQGQQSSAASSGK